MRDKVTIKIDYPKTPEGKAKWNRQYGLNAYWSGKHWAARKKDADFWHMLVKSVLPKKCKKFDKPVEIKFFWNDGLDIDNHSAIGKMIVDGMKGILFTDDGKKYVKKVSHEYHDEDYIKVEVEELKDVQA